MVNDSKLRSFPTGKGLSDQVIIQGSYTVSRECDQVSSRKRSCSRRKEFGPWKGYQQWTKAQENVKKSHLRTRVPWGLSGLRNKRPGFEHWITRSKLELHPEFRETLISSSR